MYSTWFDAYIRVRAIPTPNPSTVLLGLSVRGFGDIREQGQLHCDPMGRVYGIPTEKFASISIITSSMY